MVYPKEAKEEGFNASSPSPARALSEITSKPPTIRHRVASNYPTLFSLHFTTVTPTRLHIPTPKTYVSCIPCAIYAQTIPSSPTLGSAYKRISIPSPTPTRRNIGPTAYSTYMYSRRAGSWSVFLAPTWRSGDRRRLLRPVCMRKLWHRNLNYRGVK
ncbi:uncharacterized protein BDZ99DRAFT_264806 [Mytilinidion resinicola]|uniref:Uncharacterized protein n=1 Tax=Mytilinidion resinicola TaxID=574789 RepID=A0A6A6YVC4_9PEZI|nr:uncharacterized protein BDZ99DRAFT_264806 [Mytilinidion resinicola]KAF2812333.1 hypothetical protein BDZ99DRAFT_264806 [Mytilinidion resinicola]